MTLKKIYFNKESIGKVLIPNKILRFKYKEELQKTYEKINFDNINPRTIFNIFAGTQFILILLLILNYERIYIHFNDILDTSIFLNYVIIFLIYTVSSFILHYISLMSYYAYLESNVKKKGLQIEKDLPEFIDNLISNLKGGISLEKALLKSVRVDQKELLSEITLINEKIMIGKTPLEAIKEFRDRFDSEILKRTLFLLEEGIRSGGNLAKPLERISENLKRIQTLNDEIKGNAAGFAIIIRAISIFVAPLLFALSITLLTFIGNLFTMLGDADTGGGGMGGMSGMLGGLDEIPTEFPIYLMTFSYSMIILITFFSSLITSQLRGEKIYVAIKYIPIYIGASVILYNIFTTFLLGAFGSFIA